MGDRNNSEKKSRRWFLSGGMAEAKPPVEKVKMLTADGKLVEVDKKVVDAIANRQKVNNKEILDWMKNPSKDQL
jgi:hypothetical protein